jgi:hypothetical protein
MKVREAHNKLQRGDRLLVGYGSGLELKIRCIFMEVETTTYIRHPGPNDIEVLATRILANGAPGGEDLVITFATLLEWTRDGKPMSIFNYR